VALSVISAAFADEVVAPPLPSFALPQPNQPQEPSIWSGLYVGSEMFAISGKGSKHAYPV